MPFLDSLEYMARRQRAVRLSLLLRNYYRGLPYTDDPLDGGSSNYRLWVDFLDPDDAEARLKYLDNVSRNIIDTTVSDTLPDGTRLAVDGIEEGQREDLLEKLLNFGPGYTEGEDGLLDWCNAILVDCAQVGDGLIVPSYIGERKQIRLNYFAGELWDAERDASQGDEEVLFYRVEYKYERADGKNYWRRYDFYRDRIVRYEDKATTGTFLRDGIAPPNYMPLVMDAGFFAGTMTQREETSISVAEAQALQGIGGFHAVPVIWRRDAFDSFRGEAQVTFAQLPAIDDIQRLLNRWEDSAINVGDPTLVLFDATDPGDGTGDPNKKVSRDLGPGSFHSLQSVDDKQARIGYPDNTPSVLPHEQVLERVRQATFGNTPNMGLDPGRVSRFGELTGFANKLMRGNYDQEIVQLRRRVLTNGILRALKVAARLLAVKGALDPAMVDKISFRFEFGGPLYSPDEKLKLISGAAIMQKVGVPAPDIAAFLPFDSIDPDALVDGLEQAKAQTDLLAEMKQSLQGNPDAGPAADKRTTGPGAGNKPDSRGKAAGAGRPGA